MLSFLNRIVELQAKSVLRSLTHTQNEYNFLESLIESTKPELPLSAHHYLITTPFRYDLPVPPIYQARFRPPYFHQNCFYGTLHFHTACYEYAYHWLRQRAHLTGLSQESASRTHFTLRFSDAHCLDITRHRNVKKIMDKNDYTASHDFVKKQKKLSSILYPSCRDPQNGLCVVTFSPKTLAKKIHTERTLHLTYLNQKKACLIEIPTARATEKKIIYWQEVR